LCFRATHSLEWRTETFAVPRPFLKVRAAMCWNSGGSGASQLAIFLTTRVATGEATGGVATVGVATTGVATGAAIGVATEAAATGEVASGNFEGERVGDFEGKRVGDFKGKRVGDFDGDGVVVGRNALVRPGLP
jgi:hypothetical protein